MFDEQRLGNDGTKASRPGKPDDGDDQMKEKDDEIAHPGMVSKPEKTTNFGSQFSNIAIDRVRAHLLRKKILAKRTCGRRALHPIASFTQFGRARIGTTHWLRQMVNLFFREPLAS